MNDYSDEIKAPIVRTGDRVAVEALSPSPQLRHRTMASLNPELVQLAREFYYQYLKTGSREPFGEPTGVVVNVVTHRCDFVFEERSALLPQEVFLPLTQIKP